ncbi:MAG: site-specific integrase, partial [Candidatus Omnitrophica bacterium]|nr:site-specific integrase [Candidatus Omnitrophota bacterium]
MLGKKYLDYCQQLVDSGERSRRTLVNDREAFDRIIEVLGNDIEIGDIDKVKINEFAKAYKRKPMMRRPGLRTNESVNQKIRALSAAFSWAVNEQLIPVNPFKYFQKLPEKNPRENINIFLPSQIERFREYFKNKAPGHGAVFEFSLATMARAGGIAALCEADIFREIIDGEPADLAILHEKGKYGKTKNRVVFLDANAMYAIEIMRSWYDRVEEYCDRFMVLKDPSEYITRVKAGKVFFPYETYHSISQMFRRARQELGIKGKMHDLRKTASSLALDQGVSRRIIQEQLGHSDGKVTDNHYLKVTITALVREMRR